MKQLSKMMMAAAVTTMSVSSAMAAPVNPAASLSVVKAPRVGGSAGKNSHLAGGSGFFIAIGVGLAIIVAVIVAGSEGSKYPTSP